MLCHSTCFYASQSGTLLLARFHVGQWPSCLPARSCPWPQVPEGPVVCHAAQQAAVREPQVLLGTLRVPLVPRPGARSGRAAEPGPGASEHKQWGSPGRRELRVRVLSCTSTGQTCCIVLLEKERRTLCW